MAAVSRCVCVAGGMLVACGRIGFDVVTPRFLYWIDNGSAIERMRPDGSELTTVMTTPASCLAADPSNQQIYWCGSQSIMRAGYDGTGVELVATPTAGVFVPDVAVDASRGHVYWSEYPDGGLVRSDLLGANRTPVLAVSGVQDFELASDRTRLYYAVDIGPDRISYLGLEPDVPDGTVFDVGAVGVVNPTEIELDGVDHLFWFDSQAGKQKIQRLRVDGSEPQDIVTGAGLADDVRGLAYDDRSQQLFWSQGGIAIYRIPASGGPIESVPVPPGSAPQRLLLVDVAE